MIDFSVGVGVKSKGEIIHIFVLIIVVFLGLDD
jgi:hypothetical protein